MNVGVYITLMNDEYLLPYSFAAIQSFFPQVKVVDLGSSDSSRDLVPKDSLIKAGQQNPKNYIKLKNELSDQHDQVFWIDSDEIYPESALIRIKALLDTDPERIPSGWRSIKIENGQPWAEAIFLRGYCAWRPRTNRLYRDWPGEHLLNIDPLWTTQNDQYDPFIWCWHGVLLNRSSMPEETSRYKKRLDRYGQAQSRNTWYPIDGLPWGDKDINKYTPRSRK